MFGCGPFPPTLAGEALADALLMGSLVAVVVFVTLSYWIYAGRSTPRAFLPLVIAVFGALAAYDGITLARREYARAHDGQVLSGVVVQKLSSTGAEGRPRVRSPRYRRSQRFVTTAGFTVHEVLGRVILTGSTNAWIVEYRYACDRPQPCRGRDFVREALWRDLYAGQTVNVRRSTDETDSSRLDENPQWSVAIVTVAIATALLGIAAFVSGRLTGLRRRRYLTAPAVVMAVEPVKYQDVTRWRIRFAYFDPHGVAQESADEVQSDAWKQGDDCIAVFQAERPDLATLRPMQTA